MVPHVETPADACRIVEAVRYARPCNFADTLIVAMIESVSAIDHLRELLMVESVDVFFVGPSDLSNSMGHAGDIHHPAVNALVKKTAGEIVAGGKRAGTLATADTAEEFMRAGCRYLYAHANNFMAVGAKDFQRSLNLKAAAAL